MHEMDVTEFINSARLSEELKSIHKLQLEDKAIYDKAVRAFVSYYKAYSKYDCNLILRLKGILFPSSRCIFMHHYYKTIFLILVLCFQI